MRKIIRRHYAASDFNGEITFSESIPEEIERKISLLKDFFFLDRKNDEREPVVRAILSSCKTVRELDNMLHDVVRYDETLDEFIARNGGARNV